MSLVARGGMSLVARAQCELASMQLKLTRPSPRDN